MLENWTRPYLQKSPQKPHLFYACLGEFELDDKFHEVAASCLQDGLGCRLIGGDYFREGPMWEMAQEPARTAADGTRDAIVIEGEVEFSDDLEYLRGAIDLLSYCCEEGGKAVYDPYTLTWYERTDWLIKAEKGQILNPFDHVILLVSDDWYHTRGLLKFGRPDLSVHGVTAAEADGVKKMIDRFINFQALGGVVEEGRAIKMEGLVCEFIPGPVTGDRDDPNFNNCHIEIRRK